MDDLTSVRRTTVLKWTARDRTDGPVYRGAVEVETYPMGDRDTAVIFRNHRGQVTHAYRVRDVPDSRAPDTARDLVDEAVRTLRNNVGAQKVASELESLIRGLSYITGYDDLCPCSADSPDRSCPVHGEHPLAGLPEPQTRS